MENSKLEELVSNLHGNSHSLRNIQKLVGEEATITSANTISKYNGKVAKKIAYWIERVAYKTKDKEKTMNINNILSLNDVADTINRYNGKAAERIADRIGLIVYNTNDKEKIINMTNILSLDDIVDTVNKYKGEVVEKIANGIIEVAYNTKDTDTTVSAAKTISKYNEEVAEEIADRIGRVAYETKDADVTISTAKVISKYNGEIAEEIANWITEVAFYGGKNIVKRAIGMLDKIGRPLVYLLDTNQLIKLINSDLDRIATDREKFDAVVIYMNIRNKKDIEKPNIENIERYGDIVDDILKKDYRINKKLNLNQILMLTSLDDNDIKRIINFVNSSNETNRRTYTLSSSLEDKLNDLSDTEIKKYIVISLLGSRNPSLYKEAFDVISSMIGEKTINKGRNSLYSKYKSNIADIIKAANEKDYDKAISILNKTNDEYIKDVTNVTERRKVLLEGNTMTAVESKNPLDYDRRVQLACVYMPKPVKNGITEYCKDDNIVLVRYDIGGKTIGSAICYTEGENFLVDSVEGAREFRDDGIFDKVYEDLLYRAKLHGAKRVIFNHSSFNETPRKFINFISNSKNLTEKKLKMKLDTDAYLEANENGVEGYIVDIL